MAQTVMIRPQNAQEVRLKRRGNQWRLEILSGATGRWARSKYDCKSLRNAVDELDSMVDAESGVSIEVVDIGDEAREELR